MCTLLFNSSYPIKFYITLFLIIPFQLFSQHDNDTSTRRLQPVEVKVYFVQQPLMSLTSSTQILSSNHLTQQSGTSLTATVNTIPGIRMEERSPGSYRLTMRGSLIRSPFGIRNTKIYVDEFPLTDAGGNTYLNLLDPYSIASLTINKGPDGSLYGANSGGIIRIDPKGFGQIDNQTEIQLTGGSFGLFHEQLSLQHKANERYQFAFNQAFLRSDGYREQSALNKKTFQTSHQWQYTDHNQLRLYVLYADLGYQTPGGLTLAQYEENPKSARPAAGSIPSAAEQKAAIYNKTWLAGLTHQTKLTPDISHTISIFGSNTDFENPFITNYEYRKEKNIGMRTYLSHTKQSHPSLAWQMQLGTENYWGKNDKTNYSNNHGIPDAPMDEDKLNNYQLHIFYRAMAQLWNKWLIEASLGYNKNNIRYKEIYPVISVPEGSITFAGIWMPRVASSFQVNKNLALRASIATGYSTPTIEEIRPSDRIINTGLQAETGTNIEIGLRYALASQRLLVDIAAYRYNMQNGIVRQINELGEDYYVNAGNMDQKGVELGIWATLISPKHSGLIRHMNLHSATTHQRYRFGKYKVADNDYSNNNMTAVPNWTISNTVQIDILQYLNLNLLHQYVSRFPLNDANTVYAEKYNLLQAKLSFRLSNIKRTTLQLFVGGDNLLNEKYSLGNDINAFGGRYFNAAPTRNFYAGVKVGI